MRQKGIINNISEKEVAFLELATTPLDLLVRSASEKRKEIFDSFNSTFTLHEAMYMLNVSEKGMYMRADPLRHPLIFYFGHTAAFFVNKMVLAKLFPHNMRVDPKIESLVSVGVDEMSW